MSGRTGAAVALAVLMMSPAVATAQQNPINCLAMESGLCGAGIPVPTPRPAFALDEKSSGITRADLTYIEMSVAGETRRIRLVGPRFLQPESEAIDFTGSDGGFVDTAFNRIVAYFSDRSETTDPVVATAGMRTTSTAAAGG